MKRVSYIVCLALLLCSQRAWAQSVEDRLADSTSVKKKAKKVTWYGLTFRIGHRMSTKLNLEPESESLTMSNQFVLGWNIGKFLAPKKSWWKPFTIQLRTSVGYEVVGYNPYYRTPYPDPDYNFALAESVPVGDAGYFISRDGFRDVPRTQSGAGKTARMSDLMLTLVHSNLYTIPKAKITFDGLIRFMFPTSIQSRNATMYTALTFALGASRTFSWKVAKKVKQTLTLGYQFGFSKYFHEYKTGKIDYLDDQTYYTQEGTEYTSEYRYPRTSRNPSYAWSNEAYLAWGFYKGLSLTLSYGTTGYRTYTFKDCTFQYDPTSPLATTNLCDQAEDWIDKYNPEGERDFHGFGATLSYAPLPYLAFRLMLYTYAPQRKPNSSSIQQPFLALNRNGYSSLYLTAYLSVEKLYAAITKKQSKVAREKKQPKKLALENWR